MNSRHRMRQRTLVAMVVLLALTAGCGGGGSVSGPSGSTGSPTAVVQGQVVSGRTAARGEPIVVVVLRSALGVGVAEAQAGPPVPGATVRLTGGGTVRTTTTDPNGQFVFRDVAAGPYTLEVLDATGAVVSTVAFTVGADDQAIVGVVTNGTSTVQITAISTDVFNNDAQLGHAVNIANASSSCDLVQVTRLREQGLGWGEIAHRCNVSPSVIGLGRSNLSDTELDDARERTGHGRKHGGGSGTSGGNGKGKGNGKKA
jgi:Carboxypeptidase regulatory-like domain